MKKNHLQIDKKKRFKYIRKEKKNSKRENL